MLVDDHHGTGMLQHRGFLTPVWRRHGIGSTMLQWAEQHLLTFTAGMHSNAVFNALVLEHQAELRTLLTSNGYSPARYFHLMLRPDLQEIDIPDLPAGIEVRPVLPEHYRSIWEADTQVFSELWGRSRPTQDAYDAWLADRSTFQPNLWQIAWDPSTNQIAGQVRPFIGIDLTRPSRGFTEFISVSRPWRNRGLAKALIGRALAAQKSAEMSESALGVDTENTDRAGRLYESCGFRTYSTNAVYRKAAFGYR